MNWLKDYLVKHKDVTSFINKSKQAAHLSDVQESLLFYATYLNKKEPLIIIKENETQVHKLKDYLKALDENLEVLTYTHEESLRIEAIAGSDFSKINRIKSLNKVVQNDYDILITTGPSLLRKISPQAKLREAHFKIKINDNLELAELVKKLQKLGYHKVKYVERPFTYALRGGICDIYPPAQDNPIRVEFFDVEVESIREFDVISQRSLTSLDEVKIGFASDVLLEKEDIDNIKENLKKDYDKATIELKNEIEMSLDLLGHHLYEDSLYPYLAYLDNYETLYKYLNKTNIIYTPIERIETSIKSNYEDMVDYIQEKHNNSQFALNYNLYDDFETIDLSKSYLTYEYEGDKTIDLAWHSANIVSNYLEDTLKIIANEAKNNRVILALSLAKYEETISSLINQEIDYQLFNNQTDNGLYITNNELNLGFELVDLKTKVYTETEVYKFKLKTYRYDEKFFQSESLQRLNDLDTFDYVVHRQYGIGKYLGISTKKHDGIKKDFMRIQYRDNDELFVPIEQFHLVRKYISSEALAVRLSKLGGTAWSKTQEKIKENIDEVAERLIRLYSLRSKASGYAFSKDTEYQINFENEFPFDLTPDQEVAIKEIKEDMEKAEPMDRLLIGDVGFGKTEVAIRAAFKAVVDEKQVIFLCPTTILSSQHFETFKDRFKNYPIKIEVLNRFVPVSRQKQILKEFKAGNVDILIGTHRVLSNDVKAKDIGLLIIDEEQRFGVKHKEKIKEYKVNVDVLSLSATPIPRTLQMSLIGIRSLSQLNTAPQNRLPVMTYVIEKNKKTIIDVIQKELNREGQVFYLYNNVQRIYGIANAIKQEIPHAKVAVIHGQMDKDEIENVMVRFINKEINVLVTTTIIETGIDIPNANTIVVDNAHRFGLSQLYQIKGRVGRSDRLAYAYFLVPRKKNLTEVASKRLQAIKEFTQLGSGYKIAMRDLTIRGAGELLGGNQSGFIDSVGIELYVELLKEALDQKQNKTPLEEKENININIEAYLPESFTSDDEEKLDLYQTVDKIKDLADLNEIHTALQDRYGKLPEEVAMILEKKRLEIFLGDDRIDNFRELQSTVEVRFTKDYSANMDGVKLFEIVNEKSHDIKIKYLKQKISLSIPKQDYWFEDLIYILENIKEVDHAS